MYKDIFPSSLFFEMGNCNFSTACEKSSSLDSVVPSPRYHSFVISGIDSAGVFKFNCSKLWIDTVASISVIVDFLFVLAINLFGVFLKAGCRVLVLFGVPPLSPFHSFARLREQCFAP